MDLKTLKTLHAIVKHGSFIQAAEEMNYAQSTVTMQIQKLEADVGAKLIERGKTIRLTEAGRLFYEQSLEIAQRMEQLQANIADMQTGEAGSVRMGVTEPTASDRLPSLLHRFMTDYPHIRISMEVASTPALLTSLMQGHLDFAICSAPDVGSALYFEPLFDEKFVLIMPEDHPLAKHEHIDPLSFQGHRLLITSGTCPYRRKLEMVLQGSGVTALDTMEIGSMSALKSYVACGLGIALVPEIVLHPLSSGIIVRPLKGTPIDMLTGLVSKTTPLTLASSKLYQYLKQELSSR